jgi:hypothetical protein
MFGCSSVMVRIRASQSCPAGPRLPYGNRPVSDRGERAPVSATTVTTRTTHRASAHFWPGAHYTRMSSTLACTQCASLGVPDRTCVRRPLTRFGPARIPPWSLSPRAPAEVLDWAVRQIAAARGDQRDERGEPVLVVVLGGVRPGSDAEPAGRVVISRVQYSAMADTPMARGPHCGRTKSTY